MYTQKKKSEPFFWTSGIYNSIFMLILNLLSDQITRGNIVTDFQPLASVYAYTCSPL